MMNEERKEDGVHLVPFSEIEPKPASLYLQALRSIGKRTQDHPNNIKSLEASLDFEGIASDLDALREMAEDLMSLSYYLRNDSPWWIDLHPGDCAFLAVMVEMMSWKK